MRGLKYMGTLRNVLQNDLTSEYIHYIDSPLGRIMVSGKGDALTGLWFAGQKYFAETLRQQAEEKYLPVFARTEEWLKAYFSGTDPGFTPKLAPRGTEFRKEVWDILLTIPFGETLTYGGIAAVIAERRGQPHFSAQAVGGAVGHNPISLIIPCHRVIGAAGELTGYAGGLDRKEALLRLEKTLR